MKTKSIPLLITAWLLGPLAPSLTADDKAKIFDFGDNPGANAREEAKSEKKSVSVSKSSKSSTITSIGDGKIQLITRTTDQDGKETVTVISRASGQEPTVEFFSGEEYDKKNGAGKPKFDANNAPAEAFDMLLNDPNVSAFVKEMLRKMRKQAGVADAKPDKDAKKESGGPADENPSKQPSNKKTKSKKATE